MKRTCLMLGAFIAVIATASAQNKVHESDIMYRKSIVRALDLREHQTSLCFLKTGR